MAERQPKPQFFHVDRAPVVWFAQTQVVEHSCLVKGSFYTISRHPSPLESVIFKIEFTVINHRYFFPNIDTLSSFQYAFEPWLEKIPHHLGPLPSIPIVILFRLEYTVPYHH